MDKTQIDYNVNQALVLLNEDGKNKSIIPALPFINKALELCEGPNNLAYFITIKNIINGLTYNTQNKYCHLYLDFYKDLFNYLLPYFVKIESFPVNESDQEEAITVNSICVSIILKQFNMFAALLKGVGYLGIFALGRMKKAGNEHIIYHRAYATSGYKALEKYKTENQTIKENCAMLRQIAAKETM